MSKTIKISHISDSHGKAPKPNRKADLVVLSGDICDTYVENMTPYFKGKDGSLQATTWNSPLWNFREIDIEKEQADQREWLTQNGKLLLKLRGFKDEDIIWVNGNHDFLDPTDIFPYSVFQGAKVFTVKGVKFGVVSGVLPYNFEWNDEVQDDIISQRLELVDRDIDVLVSHVPPYMIMDKAYGKMGIGSPSIYKAIFGSHSGEEPYFNNLKAHLFGHAHEGRGKQWHEIDGRKVQFSNAAETRFDIDITIEEK
jgi:Icc-related predicted phosphoesterase